MAGKIFSSRDEISFDATLSDFVFLVHDVLEKDEEPAAGIEDLLAQLDTGLVEIAEAYQHLHELCAALAMDVLTLSVHNGKMLNELKVALRALEALAAPPNGQPFEKALLILKREGEPDISAASVNPADPNEIEMNIQLTFTEEKLAEALRIAISEYINETVFEALD
jgi:hypothetical protein